MDLLLLALVPALALLVFYHERDRHTEPRAWVALVFGLGAVSCLWVYPLQRFVQRGFPTEPTFLEALVVGGLIEETNKLLIVLLAVWWRPDFDEPVDGLIYGISAALGFTFGEDLRWYLVHGADWSRLASVAAHPWFSVFWATGLGRARFLPFRKGIVWILGGLAASVLVHGLFDYFIFRADADRALTWLRFLLAPLLVALCWVTEIFLESMQEGSSSNVVTNETQIKT